MNPASAREASASTPPNAGEHGIEGFFRAQSLPGRPAREIPRPRVNVNDIRTWLGNVETETKSDFEKDPLSDVFLAMEEYLNKLDFRETDLNNFRIMYHCISAWDHSEPQIKQLKSYMAEERSKKRACQAALAAIRADMERVQSRIAAYRWWLKSARITETHLGILKRLSRSFVLIVGHISLSITEVDSSSKRCAEMKELETELAAARAKIFEIRTNLKEDLTAMFEKISVLGREAESTP
ncbi:hypothetical protein CkaCkLH20_09096 [Colletotrichum karsti]|uniref:Uncharacterized protein n=1 Tax=Colletotrichum karsti TaxID=1095194 RepID=A0A9P6LH83_9PEZI|nr:uncharacterized protein CkaCkLH20_09096 [Colletotrichum karsti]KAF9873283.1 hypothetical protein CkaCkLH20_09096 [Colletotrichum karsti]